MARRRWLLSVVPSALAVTVWGADAPSLNQFVGAWTLNLAKSRLSVPIASQLMTITKVAPDTLRIEYDELWTTGERKQQVKLLVCDGQEHHTEGTKPGRTDVCDPRTQRVTSKQDGKVISTLSTVFSPDGKTHTVTRTVLNPQGKQTTDVIVHERKQ
jgi:hypothetical protein